MNEQGYDLEANLLYPDDYRRYNEYEQYNDNQQYYEANQGQHPSSVTSFP